MKNEITMPVPCAEQVVSVIVPSNIGQGTNSNIESLLKEHFFTITEIKASAGKPSTKLAVAPDNGVESFALLELIREKSGIYPTYKFYRIDRGTKHVIAIIDVRFAPDTLADTKKQYSGSSEQIPDWVIITKPASAEVLERAARFVGNRTTIKESEYMPPIVIGTVGESKVSLKGTVDPIKCLQEKYPLFRAFVEKYCTSEDGSPDYRITSLSRVIAAYIDEHKITVSNFSRSRGVMNSAIFEQIVAVSRLHPQLQPLLDVSQKEEIEQNKDRLTLRVARIIADIIDPEQQLKAWERIKIFRTDEKRTREIRKFREERKWAI
ncbi:MAG TPA: hypothetical protein VL335_03805 [Candidatus Paceibacterota bacterium]|jgi:hypothetical protein|nr:hypothetical protein [Candidatus Paceibacterota bacterium]